MVFGKRLAYARCSINKNTSLVEYDSPFTTGVLKLWTSHRVNGSQRELSYLPSCVFQVALVVKNPPAMQEMQVGSLGQEDALEKEMATHSSYSCLENSMDGGAWWATVHGITKSQTQLSD